MSASFVIFVPLKDIAPTTWDALVVALEDKERATRAAAVHVVAMHNDPALREKLVRLMAGRKSK
jgi:hypothetical protein